MAASIAATVEGGGSNSSLHRRKSIAALISLAVEGVGASTTSFSSTHKPKIIPEESPAAVRQLVANSSEDSLNSLNMEAARLVSKSSSGSGIAAVELQRDGQSKGDSESEAIGERDTQGDSESEAAGDWLDSPHTALDSVHSPNGSSEQGRKMHRMAVTWRESQLSGYVENEMQELASLAQIPEAKQCAEWARRRQEAIEKASSRRDQRLAQAGELLPLVPHS